MARILTIEDDAVTAGEIIAELQVHGNQVDYAVSGTEGLARAIAGNYDVITLDRMLPGLDGLSLVRQPARGRCAHAGADDQRPQRCR